MVLRPPISALHAVWMDKGYVMALSISQKARIFAAFNFFGFLLVSSAVQATEASAMESPKCGESTERVFRQVTATGKSRYPADTSEAAARAAERECKTALRSKANITAGTNTCNNEDCVFNSCRSCTLTRVTSVEKETTAFSNLKVETVKEKPRGSGNQLDDAVSLLALFFGNSKEKFQATVDCTADILVKDSCDECSFWYEEDKGLVRPTKQYNPLLNPESQEGEECLALAEETTGAIE